MSGADVISLAITLFAIAAESWFTNVRISGLAAVMNKGFDDMCDLMRSEPDLLCSGQDPLRTQNAHTQDKLDAIIRRLVELNARLRHLE